MSGKRIAVVEDECVACGTCVRVCPVDALSVPNGIRSVVDAARCVGCGQCEKTCPAGVIQMAVRSGEAHEEGAVA